MSDIILLIYLFILIICAIRLYKHFTDSVFWSNRIRRFKNTQKISLTLELILLGFIVCPITYFVLVYEFLPKIGIIK